MNNTSTQESELIKKHLLSVFPSFSALFQRLWSFFHMFSIEAKIPINIEAFRPSDVQYSGGSKEMQVIVCKTHEIFLNNSLFIDNVHFCRTNDNYWLKYKLWVSCLKKIVLPVESWVLNRKIPIPFHLYKYISSHFFFLGQCATFVISLQWQIITKIIEFRCSEFMFSVL